MTKATRRTFIDLFAGCGGLSLGLSGQSWKGIFAVEKAAEAFKTFEANFLSGPLPLRFDWPHWLPRQPLEIESLLEEKREQLAQLSVAGLDLVAGGPPCQGFSFAGRRVESDPRNALFQKYVELVALVKPRALILENVPGMLTPHGQGAVLSVAGAAATQGSYYARLIEALEDAGYVALGKVLDASKFGVPQRRTRLIVIGVRRDLTAYLPGGIEHAFSLVDEARQEFLAETGLTENTTVADAISDLAGQGIGTEACIDSESRAGFEQYKYYGPESAYQELMHVRTNAGQMDSMRLARHSPVVRARFEELQAQCRRGTKVSDSVRRQLGISKHRICMLSPDMTAPTVTTLPEDMLHYSEPRILTVRECARLQSFPDWFRFKGNFTTGGAQRKKSCPRYTQVGNAVPPLMARALGEGIARMLGRIDAEIARAGEPGESRRAYK